MLSEEVIFIFKKGGGEREGMRRETGREREGEKGREGGGERGEMRKGGRGGGREGEGGNVMSCRETDDCEM